MKTSGGEVREDVLGCWRLRAPCWGYGVGEGLGGGVKMISSSEKSMASDAKAKLW
jgi:hypothetical protein